MTRGITEISLDEIAALGLDEKKPKTSKGRKSINYNDRSMETWFKLHTTFGNCDNPYCKDERPKKVVEGKAMVAVVKEKNMCRICFIGGWLNG